MECCSVFFQLGENKELQNSTFGEHLSQRGMLLQEDKISQGRKIEEKLKEIYFIIHILFSYHIVPSSQSIKLHFL